MSTLSYTVRSEGGAIRGCIEFAAWELAAHEAQRLATLNPGQVIGLYRDGEPVKVRTGGRLVPLTWTSGEPAGVQR